MVSVLCRVWRLQTQIKVEFSETEPVQWRRPAVGVNCFFCEIKLIFVDFIQHAISYGYSEVVDLCFFLKLISW